MSLSLFCNKPMKMLKTGKKLVSQIEKRFLEIRPLCSQIDFWGFCENIFAETIFVYTILDIYKCPDLVVRFVRFCEKDVIIT